MTRMMLSTPLQHPSHPRAAARRGFAVVVVLAATLGLPLAAHAAAYVGAAVGIAHPDRDALGDRLAFGIDGGYRWRHFGVEARLQTADRFDPLLAGSERGPRWQAVGVGSSWQQPFASAWAWSARLGVMYSRVREPAGRDRHSAVYAGIGIGRQLSRSTWLGLHVDSHRARADGRSLRIDVLALRIEQTF